jgi:sugar phosphate permease
LLVVTTAGAAAVVYLLVPEVPLRAKMPNQRPFAGLKTIYSDPRFWRLAPLAANTIGTAWALQSLWAASWLADVEGLDRAGLVHHLFAMAVALSFGALLLGIAADRLRRRGLDSQMLFGIIAALFIVAQIALISRCGLPSYVSWCAVAIVGAGTTLSYAAVAEYFPKELAGRANAALNVFHIAGAFLLQGLTGIVIQQWPMQNGHYPVIAYRTAFAINVGLQTAALFWFTWPWLLTAANNLVDWLRDQVVGMRRTRTRSEFCVKRLVRN